MDIAHDATQTAVLTCWKDIARYLGKGVRTVQRWEQQFGLPVHRPLRTSQKSTVIAHPQDLDNWLKERWFDRAGSNRATSLPAINLPDSELDNTIRKSHQLRTANEALVKDISVALQTLIQNCDRLVAKRQEFEILGEGQQLLTTTQELAFPITGGHPTETEPTAVSEAEL